MNILPTSLFQKYFTPTRVNVSKVLSERPTVTYVGQFPLKTTSYSVFTDWHADVFYDPSPNVLLGHQHYFAMYAGGEHIFVTSASHVESMLFTAYDDGHGDYIYPRFQHDFRYFGDADKYFCDGGAWLQSEDGVYEMTGRVGSFIEFPQLLNFKVKDGKFCKV